MVRWTPPLTRGQQIVLAIIPKFTASLSIFGSVFILQHIIRNPKCRTSCYHRILLGLSSMDVISSFKSFLSTWILPRETGAWGAVGTVGTCTAAGFFGQGSSIASPLYNGSLALFYLLTVKFGWKDDGSGAYGGSKFSKVEPFMHAIPLVFGWSTAIAGLPLTLYNPIGWTCWIGEVPRGCDRDPSVQCVRGNNSYIYRWAFFHAELWFTFLAILVMMVMLYQSVRQKEKASERYLVASSGAQRSQSKSRKVFMQALLYVLAYYVTWIFPAVTWLTQLIKGKTYTPVLMLQAIFVPLQGFFNAAIYLRPKYFQYKKKMPNESRFRVFLVVLGISKKKEDIGQRERNEGDDGRGDVHSDLSRSRNSSSFHSRISQMFYRSSLSLSSSCHTRRMSTDMCNPEKKIGEPVDDIIADKGDQIEEGCDHFADEKKDEHT